MQENAKMRQYEEVAEIMEPPPQPTARTWFKSSVPWRIQGCNGSWKNNPLKLRVVRQDTGEYYVAPWSMSSFRAMYSQLKVGPYNTLEDAQLAAEMIGEIKGEPND